MHAARHSKPMVVASSEAKGLDHGKAVADRLQGRIVYRTVEISHLRFEMTTRTISR